MSVSLAARPRVRGLISEPAAAWLVAGVALVGGALLSVGVALGTQDFYRRQLEQRFELVAGERFSRTQERFDDQLQKLDGLRRFFVYAEQVSREEFAGYVQPLLSDTLAYVWVPRIRARDRPAFEANVRAQGFPDFSIRERDSAGALRPAAERPEYFPLLYSLSRPGGEQPLGLDLAAPGAGRQVFERARLHGKLAVSERLRLAGANEVEAASLMLLAPVYPRALPPGNVGERRAALRGFVQALLSARQLMEAGMTEESTRNLSVQLADVSRDHLEQLLYRSPQAAAESELLFRKTLRLGDRLYELSIRPSAQFMQANRSPALALQVTVGLLLSLLLGALLHILVSQRQRALALVQQRTAQLRAHEHELLANEERWHFALDSAGHGVWDWQPQSGRVFYSPSWKAMLGYADEEIPGNLEACERLVHPQDNASRQAELERHLRGETPLYQSEHRMHHKDGHWLWILDRGQVIERQADGAPQRMVGTQTDISARKAAELELARTHGQLRSVLDAATQVAIIATDLRGRILTFNVGAELMLGYRAADMIGRRTPERLLLRTELEARARELTQHHGRPLSGFEVLVAEAAEEGRHAEREWTWVRRDGSQLRVNLIVTGVRDEQAELVGYLGIAIDITERKRVQESLEARDRLLEKLTARVPGAIYQFQLNADGSSCFPYASAGIREVYEVEPEALRADGSEAFRRIHPDDLERVRASTRRSAEQLGPWREDYRVLLPRQGLRWLRGEAVPERQADGSVLWHGYLSDITGLKLVELELRALSITDALTGAYNRRYFQERLETEIARAQRHEGPLAVIMLDIDHFKSINDRFGHEAGDRVLKSICRRLTQRLRRIDVFCRLGGEEFIVLCPSTDGEQARVLADALWRELRREPVEGVGAVSASFGIASWREGEGADALLRRVDAGVYAAKLGGRDRVEPEQS